MEVHKKESLSGGKPPPFLRDPSLGSHGDEADFTSLLRGDSGAFVTNFTDDWQRETGSLGQAGVWDVQTLMDVPLDEHDSSTAPAQPTVPSETPLQHSEDSTVSDPPRSSFSASETWGGEKCSEADGKCATSFAQEETSCGSSAEEIVNSTEDEEVITPSRTLPCRSCPRGPCHGTDLQASHPAERSQDVPVRLRPADEVQAVKFDPETIVSNVQGSARRSSYESNKENSMTEVARRGPSEEKGRTEWSKSHRKGDDKVRVRGQANKAEADAPASKEQEARKLLTQHAKDVSKVKTASKVPPFSVCSRTKYAAKTGKADIKKSADKDVQERWLLEEGWALKMVEAAQTSSECIVESVVCNEVEAQIPNRGDVVKAFGDRKSVV